MMKYRFKPKNLKIQVYQKSKKFRDVSVWKNIFYNFTTGLDWQNEHGRHKYVAERIVWLTIYIIAIIGALFMIIDFTLTYKTSPTVTTPETRSIPIQNVDFPAVAICDVNRISQKAVIDLAYELVELESTTFSINLTVPDLTRMLHLIGQLYNLHELKDTDAERIKQLHTILERSYNGYDVDRIMKRGDTYISYHTLTANFILFTQQLSPKCRSILRKCSWKGQDVVCDDIFVLRKTQNGYCCTFNYARRNEGFGSVQNDVFASQHVERIMNIGSEYGLSVLLNIQLDDYFFKILPINGFKVLVYNPFDYPDVSSGQVREILISPKTETYVDLDAVIFHTTKDVEGYDIQERDCLFQTEQSKIFHGYYSFSDCIVYCRLRDTFRLCGCVPFLYPTKDPAKNNAYWRICNLKDLSCLKKYKEKWRNVKPRFENIMTPFNDTEFEESSGYLSCDCFPSCTDITYNVQSSSIPLSLSELSWGRGKYSIRNHSVLHIYFGKTEVIRLRQDVLYYWYDLMSNYGGVLNLFLGVSIINVIEILYSFIIRIFYPTTANQSTKEQIKEKIQESQNIAMKVMTIAVEPVKLPEIDQPLHWGELTGAFRVRKEQSEHQINQSEHLIYH